MRGLELGINKSRTVDISSSINSYRARLPRKLIQLIQLPKHTHSIASTTTRGVRQSYIDQGSTIYDFQKQFLWQLLHRLRFGCLLLLSTQGEYFVSEAFYTKGFWLLDAMYLVNSMVNPLVYSFRMQIFKDALPKF